MADAPVGSRPETAARSDRLAERAIEHGHALWPGAVPYLRAFSRLLGGAPATSRPLLATKQRRPAREKLARFYIPAGLLPETSVCLAHAQAGEADFFRAFR